MMGFASGTDSQPTGGEAGGDIKNCLSGFGGCRCGEELFSVVRVCLKAVWK